jgi:hypothetical protein
MVPSPQAASTAPHNIALRRVRDSGPSEHDGVTPFVRLFVPARSNQFFYPAAL